MFDLAENLKDLPAQPGVYLHKDKYGEIIYVGKAASLRNRVRQYFGSYGRGDPKVRAMVGQIAEFEYIVTRTEMEALILENTLIKRYLPRYNVLLRDDKTFPYIRITLSEDYPRILKTRTLKNDGSRYFGPYADVKAVNRILSLLNDIYQLKRCSAVTFPPGFRPCLNGHINRCRRVCVGDVDREEYQRDIHAIIAFLKGQSGDVIKFLKEKMDQASAAMHFEEAAQYRDYISAARAVTEKQRVELLSSGSMDIVLSSRISEDGVAQVTVFFVRDGRLTGREFHHLDVAKGDEKKQVVAAFLTQYYSTQTVFPREILLEERIEDEELIQEMLSKASGTAVRIRVPERGRKKELLHLAISDVQESEKHLKERIQTEREKAETLDQTLIRLLEEGRETIPSGHSGGPLRLEAYDISHTGGSDSVGAMVVFTGGKPCRNDYRRFRIRGEGGDDYASMQEVLYRRLKRAVQGDRGFASMPDLILLDGGSGHVSAVKQILSAMKLDLAVAGMVKDDHHRTRGLVVNGQETDLKDLPELYHLIGAIQEEVHRFVLDYHRGARKSNAVRSLLDDIPGVGEKRRNALLMKFGGVEAIKQATEEELSSVPGMNRAAARKILDYFRS